MDFFSSEIIFIVAVYLRLSKEDGDLDTAGKSESNSIQNQKALILNFLKKLPNVKIYDIYVDDGYTGTNFDRPDFKRMKRDFLEGRVNMVVVKDLSRFGRDYVEAGNYVRNIFRNLNIRFVSVLDHFDSLTATSTDYNLLLPVKNFVNDQYSSDISTKVRGNQGAMREAGKYIGPYVGYGFLKSPQDKHIIIVDEYAWEIIMRMVDWKYAGFSNQRIADQLNATGVLSPAEYKRTLGCNYKSGFQTKNKAKWTSVAVKRVLSNPMNKGIMIQGKRKRINYKVRKVIEKPQEQWNIKHNAVVTPMPLLCYDNVQRLLEQDIRVAPGQENVYLFAGMVYCADCGRSMTRRKTNENIFYICTTYNRGDGCSRHSIPNEKLKEVVLQTIRQYIETLMETDEILTYLDTLDIKESEIKISLIDSIIHRFTGMSSVVFSPLYHYQYSFSYLYFEVILYAAHHIMLYHYQHIPVYPYSDVTPYTARHSFGTLMLSSGIPIESIAKMMGHSSIASTQIYAQITDQKIARDMERVM